jgi:hypothetical protein
MGVVVEEEYLEIVQEGDDWCVVSDALQAIVDRQPHAKILKDCIDPTRPFLYQ